MHRAMGLGSVSEGKQPHFNSEKLRKRIFIFSIRVSSDVEKKCHRKTIFTVVRHQGTESYGSTGT